MAASTVEDIRNVAFRQTAFPKPHTLCERRIDGTIILRSGRRLEDPPQKSFSDCVAGWAAKRGDLPAFRQRDSFGAWRTINWNDLWLQLRSAGAALLELKLNQDRPVMLLSGNSIEQAILLLAAEYVGVPAVLVSPAYSMQGPAYARLRGLRELIRPGAVFVQDFAQYEDAIGALGCADSVVITVSGGNASQIPWREIIATPLTSERINALEQAHSEIVSEQVARIMFTSGSTGLPKAVPISYDHIRANVAYQSDALGALMDRQPVFLDWLPWHHAYGGIVTFGMSMVLGGAFHIDDGRPLPGQFERTVRNLREVAPTIFTNVPSGWALLAYELERDPVLAKSFFSNMINFSYGGASLSRDVWDRIQKVAQLTVGERIAFCSGLSSTETAGGGTYCSWGTDDIGNIGVPKPGVEIKLVPLDSQDGRYEMRLRGRHTFAGYLNRPDLTKAAFDEEGFFKLGDAVRFADPEDPGCGLHFAGRVVEDFKLANGTWVRTGTIRLQLLDKCSPLLTDAVICGHDRDFVAALAWPNLAACRELDPVLVPLDANALAKHPIVLSALREKLNSQAATASARVERVILLSDLPSADANEIADKGYINQAAVRSRRAPLIEEVYQLDPPSYVVSAGKSIKSRL